MVGYVLTMLVVGMTCTKHKGFDEEREWRALYLPTLWSSPLMEQGIEIISGVPQRVYKLPLDGTLDPALADLDFSRNWLQFFPISLTI